MSLWTSFLVRTYAWMVLLGNNGPIIGFMNAIGIDAPPQLLFTRFASTLAMVHILAPYMIMNIYSVMRKVDPKITDAGTGQANNPELGACAYAPTGAAADGQDVTLLIRPEHIRLSRKPLEGRKNVRMLVETIANYGDNALVIGRVGDLPMRVRLLGADVVIIKEGEECCISWMPEAVVVIDR